MPHLNYLAFGLPIILLLIAVEYRLSLRRNRQYFTYGGSIVNLSIGIADRLLNVFTYGLYYAFFKYLYEHFALFSFEQGLFTWIILFVLTDFLWYWYHRLGHEINLFWAVHIVHHQSDEFNFTVSARITVFQAFVRTLFWALMPLLGFSAEMIMSILLIHGVYPFFVHTQTIGKLGWLEYVLVTPSHHKLHHASNPEYLDKNYGDVLIIWDKLFGTYVEETVEPVFGLTQPLNSYSFLWQHFHYWLELREAMRQAPTWWAKCKVLWGAPKDLHPQTRDVVERQFLKHQKPEAPIRPLRSYINFQMVVSLAMLFFFVLLAFYIPLPIKILIAAWLLITLINCGAILEQRRWIFYLEYGRFMLSIWLLYYCIPHVAVLFVGMVAVFLVGCSFSILERKYLHLIYKPLTS